MLVKRANPGNLPGILAETGIGLDGVLVKAAESNVVKAASDHIEEREIEPTVFQSMRLQSNSNK